MMWLGITIVCVLTVFGGLKLKRRLLTRKRRLEREAIEATMEAPAPVPFSRRLASDAQPDADWQSHPIPVTNTVRPPKPDSVAMAENLTSASTASTATAPPPTEAASLFTEYQYLENLLKEQRYEEADRVTWRIVLQLAGAEGRGYLELDEVMLLPHAELVNLDQLWHHYSDGRWGFTMQRRLFEQSESDYSGLGKVTGWMVDGTWLQKQNTIYDLEQSPQGHLPQEIWRNMFSVFDAFGLSLGIEIFLMHDAFDPASPPLPSEPSIDLTPSEDNPDPAQIN
jgi:hypothetical protein